MSKRSISKKEKSDAWKSHKENEKEEEQEISCSAWPEARRSSTATALQFCLTMCYQESLRKSSRFGTEWDASDMGLCS
jgi:hypothetical protein